MKEKRSYVEAQFCRICGSDALRDVLSLGEQRVVDFTSRPGDTEKPLVPLTLCVCARCYVTQLRHTTAPDILFTEFWYRSGINEMMRAALQDIVVKGYEKAQLRDGDAILDIGANDGTMLSMFPDHTITVGMDPSNIIDTEEARSNMKYAVRDYFNAQTANKIINKIGKKFKLITAIAMFYDLEDPVEFLSDIRQVLADDGVLVIQMNYLLSMLQNNAFDNVCHEHITYFSLTAFRWMLSKSGFEIIDVETNSVNGGSFRVYAKRVPISHIDLAKGSYDRVRMQIELEKEYGLNKLDTYIQFGHRVKTLLQLLTEYIVELVSQGNTVYGYGASTRGTVTLQSTPVPLPLAGVAERDQKKLGKFIVANWYKIVTEEFARERCKYMLVLPWHFEQGIIEREKEWIENGGTLIFPLGGTENSPHIVNKEGTKTLHQLRKEKVPETVGDQNVQLGSASS